MIYTPKPVPPIASRTRVAFIDRDDGTGEAQESTVDVFPPSTFGKILLAEATGRGMLLIDVARVLDMSPADVSRLVRGQTTLSLDQWQQAIARVRKDGPT